MKLTGLTVIKCSHKYLYRLKTRVHKGCITINDRKHSANLIQAIGFIEKQIPNKSISTPGGDRAIEEKGILNNDDVKSY